MYAPITHPSFRIHIRVPLTVLAEEWIAKDAPRLRPTTYREHVRVLRKEVLPVLGALRADRIEGRDVAGFPNSLADRPGISRNAFCAISQIYRWARKQGVVERNPADGLNPRKPRARDRVLTEQEIREAWHAAVHPGDYGRILRLCLLTGCRREEIGALTWSEVNREARQLELAAIRTKNGRPHIVPLSELPLTQLPPPRNGFPNLFGRVPGRTFSGWHEGGEKLAEHLGYKPSRKTWTLHDLRRTLVTYCAEKGLAQPHVLEAVVNHISGHRAGVAGIYNRAAYADQKRELLERWSRALARIVG